MNRLNILPALTIFAALAFTLGGCGAGSKGKIQAPSPADTARTISPYFTAGTNKWSLPDNDGFIRRWLLLDPINKPNRSNTVFTDSYLRSVFTKEIFPGQFTGIPNDGDAVRAADQDLTWHALEAGNFNVKLYRLAYGLGKQTYGVLFLGVTVVECTEEIKNVRLAAGSNSASMWWVNGAEVLLLSGDRRMVMDDGLSKRITLNKGKNIIRVAVINGPGMSDFCMRFLGDNGQPVKNISVSYK
ncbi:MAG: acetylxylan esterase [Chitinophagaceae bacterium]|nr:MAG: acetylxylan esterase [Chitinophagaceae bacterium]